jgi:CheY-like chemotaxis protein
MATILVVDDRREHRKATRQVLERAGHRVIETDGGQAALDRARIERPDLVLSDVLMPGMDGFTLCRRAQEDADLRHVPFVFMSGTFSDPRYEQCAAELGAVAVLPKPLDAISLRSAVDRALLRGAATDANGRPESLDEGASNARSRTRSRR